MTNRVFSLSAERAWLEDTAKKTDAHYFAIVHREDNRLLGIVNFFDIHPVNRTVTLGIFIGEAADRNKGYGTEALRLIVDYGFRWLGLRNIDLHVNSDNLRAIACYEKAGFKEYGRRRNAIFADGQLFDIVCMQILPEDRS